MVRLRPAPHCRTPIEAYSLEVSPKNHFLNWQQDPFGNWLARLVFPEKIDQLEITVGLVADLMVINPFDFFIEEYAERFPFAYEPTPGRRPGAVPAAGRRQRRRPRAWREALPPLPDDGVPTVQFLADLNAAVNRDVAYDVRMEPGVQTPDETLRRADRLVPRQRVAAGQPAAAVRPGRPVRLRLPRAARRRPYVTEALDGPSGPSQDFTDLHAWAEVYVPGAGWVGMDPTSALFAGEGHIPLSATPHPSSAAPIEGATEPVEVTFGFVNEVHPRPRGPAGHQALHRRSSGRGSTRSARRSTSGWPPATSG